LLLVVLGLRASTGLSVLSCMSAIVTHIIAVYLRMNKMDYYYLSLGTVEMNRVNSKGNMSSTKDCGHLSRVICTEQHAIRAGT